MASDSLTMFQTSRNVNIQGSREREEEIVPFLLTRSDHALPACPASKIIESVSPKEKARRRICLRTIFLKQPKPSFHSLRKGLGKRSVKNK
mgnify:CR=1 FL=1